MAIQPIDIGAIDDTPVRSMHRAAAELPVAEQSAPARSVEEPQASDKDPVQAFVSPVIRFDSVAGVAVLQFREGDTGEPQYQVPSRRVVMEYREQMRAAAASKGDTGESA